MYWLGLERSVIINDERNREEMVFEIFCWFIRFWESDDLR